MGATHRHIGLASATRARDSRTFSLDPLDLAYVRVDTHHDGIRLERKGAVMRYGDLPERGDMSCSGFGEVHGVYSATSGDYFWADDRDEITCSECGAPMELVRHVEYWEPVR